MLLAFELVALTMSAESFKSQRTSAAKKDPGVVKLLNFLDVMIIVFGGSDNGDSMDYERHIISSRVQIIRN